MNYIELAELLFPNPAKTPQQYEEEYPRRSLPTGARVTRLGPSPTGFIHLGNLYTAFANERLAHESGGIFYLRIEDTDHRREVEGAADAMIAALKHYGIRFDEGVTPDGESGAYGPYYQSARKEIYHAFVKQLVQQGKAYPCFLSEEEITAIRAGQEAQKRTPGIYGPWARHRDLPLSEVRERLQAGQGYVLRYRSGGDPEKTFTVIDGIRGPLTMPENEMDVVLLKNNGIPTYHFAHVVDDHLMRTTHVIRGEEWLSSLPIHVALFAAMGWEPPVYCHTTVLMKMEGETKRKLSKRKDPELSLDYYTQEGYHPLAVREYLMTIMNSNFEEWRTAHPHEDIDAFPFTTEKMSVSGILFDLDKLMDVSREVLVRIPATALARFLVDWASAACPELVQAFEADMDYLVRILDIGRSGDKPRKDLACGRQIFDFIGYFYDEYFRIEDPYPQHVPAADIPLLLEGYLETYSPADDQPGWFDKVRTLAVENGYAAKPKDFKKNPDQYKGHVGDVSTVIRIALTGRSSSPDLWEIQQILGEGRTRQRISNAAAEAR